MGQAAVLANTAALLQSVWTAAAKASVPLTNLVYSSTAALTATPVSLMVTPHDAWFSAERANDVLAALEPRSVWHRAGQGCVARTAHVLQPYSLVARVWLALNARTLFVVRADAVWQIRSTANGAMPRYLVPAVGASVGVVVP